MLWLLSGLPAAGAGGVWLIGHRRPRAAGGAVATAVLAAVTGLAAWAATVRPEAAYRWGAGLTLRLSVDGPAAVAAVLVPAVALVVAAYAAAHEPERGLGRLLATLVAFVGAMELLVVADDVLTLLIGWELVGACSWALIGHEWWRVEKPAAAGHAFLVTRFGDLGLFAAVAAAFAGAGSLSYGALPSLDGAWLQVFVAGVVLAAAAKSAQLPFSPWLFSAMEGPTSVSALLHAATMVAAGAYALVRLDPVLSRAAWFGPVVITVGLATALAGGLVAAVQGHAKKLLAASTSAQYGLMFVAVGAGFPAAALAHLTTHAAFKAGLFLAAGVAIEAVGTARLDRMALARAFPAVAAASAVLALALAAVPPLGAAWSKEAVAAAAGHRAPWLAVAVAAAGALSAWYAARFQLLAFGLPRGEPPGVQRRPRAVETTAVVVAAAASLAFGALWWPGAEEVLARLAGPLPSGSTWETALSLAVVGLALYGAAAVWRVGTLSPSRPLVAGWFAIPAATKAAVVDPALAFASALDRFDRVVLDAPPRGLARSARFVSARVAAADGRVVDAGVRAAARAGQGLGRLGATVTERGFDGAVRHLAAFVTQAGRDTRRLHTGLAHQYYVVVAAGAILLVLLAVAGR